MAWRSCHDQISTDHNEYYRFEDLTGILKKCVVVEHNILY